MRGVGAISLDPIVLGANYPAHAYPCLLYTSPVRVYDIQQQLAVLDDDVLDRFGVDTIELGRGFALDDADWTDWALPDGTPCQVPVWVAPERTERGWVCLLYTSRCV